jgi:hypothetical protein
MKAGDSKTIGKLMQNNHEIEQKISSFGDVMKNTSDIDEKKKALWQEVYSNAHEDRLTAQSLFIGVFSKISHSDMSTHIALGPIAIKYLERMTKANDQLLSLCEIVAKEIGRQAELNTEDIFKQIEG